MRFSPSGRGIDGRSSAAALLATLVPSWNLRRSRPPIVGLLQQVFHCLLFFRFLGGKCGLAAFLLGDRPAQRLLHFLRVTLGLIWASSCPGPALRRLLLFALLIAITR